MFEPEIAALQTISRTPHLLPVADLRQARRICEQLSEILSRAKEKVGYSSSSSGSTLQTPANPRSGSQSLSVR